MINIKRIVIIFAFVVVLIIGVFSYIKYSYSIPTNVELTEIARLETNEDLGNGGYWAMVYDKEHSVARKYNIQIPDVDFSKYNLIFSTGREIKELTYKKGETLPYGDNVYKGYPIFKKDLHSHTIFFYRVAKISIHEDDFSKPEEIKIED